MSDQLIELLVRLWAERYELERAKESRREPISSDVDRAPESAADGATREDGHEDE